MILMRIALTVAVLTGFGSCPADAVTKLPVSSTKTHAEVTMGARLVTVSNEPRPLKSKPTHFCATVQGVAYGAAFVGFQSILIVLPSFASGVGAPVAAIATGVGVASSGVGFVTMVAHDVVCK